MRKMSFESTISGRVDFSNCSRVWLNLDGAMDKLVVRYNEDLYIIKLDNIGEQQSVSEYLASKLAKSLNIECQDVLLGTYEGRNCCALKYFLNSGEQLHSYKEINDSSVSNQSQDVRDLPYDLYHILHTIQYYKNLNIPVNIRLFKFIEMVYFDTLIGNFDRHWGNWGFKGKIKEYSIAPLFDNGSSLFPKRKSEDLINYSKEYIEERTFTFPRSAIKANADKNKPLKYNYKDLVMDLNRVVGTKVLSNFCERVSKVEFSDIVNDAVLVSILPRHEREFLLDILNSRFDNLLKGALNETL